MAPNGSARPLSTVPTESIARAARSSRCPCGSVPTRAASPLGGDQATRELRRCAAKAIEHVRSEQVGVHKKRMVEIVAWIACHPETVHDLPRALVADGREGNDLPEAELIEAERDRRASAFDA